MLCTYMMLYIPFKFSCTPQVTKPVEMRSYGFHWFCWKDTLGSIQALRLAISYCND